MSYMVIENLSNESPLNAKDIQLGDIIIGINNLPVNDNNDISKAVCRPINPTHNALAIFSEKRHQRIPDGLLQ